MSGADDRTAARPVPGPEPGPEERTQQRADTHRHQPPTPTPPTLNALPPSAWTGPGESGPADSGPAGRVGRGPTERTSRARNWRTQPVPLWPTVAQGVDLLILMVLSVVALAGFRETYGGWQYLIVGALGVLLGTVIGHLGVALRQPLLAALVAAALTFFLLGGAVALRTELAVGFLPTPEALRSLTSVSIHGWKDLLTTLPPVGNTGSLLVIPYLLGILGGVAGASLAERTRAAFAPLSAPLTLLLAVILLGTATPAALWLQGAVFAALGLGWLALRARRARRTLRTGTGNRTRLVTAVAMLAVAGSAGLLVGPHLPGHDSHRRLVLRDYVTPPFDVSQFPSPLAAFRKYTKQGPLYDTELFRVSGLPAGTPIKIATLDDYNGTAWVSSNTIDHVKDTSTFQRIGSSIATAVEGRAVSGQVAIGAGYRDVWVPIAGALTRIRFSGGDSDLRAYRYNLASTTGVLQRGLHPGDIIRFNSIIPAQSSKDYGPYSAPIVSADFYQFTRSKIASWYGDATEPWAQLGKVADWMRQNGKYTDGGTGTEAVYFAGHGLGRLTDMLNAEELVGDDEQYAALFALVAGELGYPARVVLGAIPEADGTVRGRDVHAWIEVHLASGQWRSIASTQFVPDASHHPDKPPQQQEQNAEGKSVPPPNTVKPPTTQQNPEEPQANAARTSDKKKHTAPVHLPSALLRILSYIGLPILVLAALLGGIVAAKAWRRRRRRTRGSPAERIAAGWRELLDRARDFGASISAVHTRPEQASALGQPNLSRLAGRADAGVFAAGVPSAGAVEAYWIEVNRARRDFGHGRSWWRRLRAAISLRSWRRTRESSVRRIGPG